MLTQNRRGWRCACMASVRRQRRYKAANVQLYGMQAAASRTSSSISLSYSSSSLPDDMFRLRLTS